MRTLQDQTPPRFNPVEGWPEVNAAWIGTSLTYVKDEYTYYVVSFAVCSICSARIENVYWSMSINWVSDHNQNC